MARLAVITIVLLLVLPSALAANYPLQVIQPQEGLSTVNRYYKAYPGIEYKVPIGVFGGAYPFTYSLTTAPSGMSIDETTGIVTWPNPTTTGSPHTITARVTDQEGAIDTVTWTITVTTQGFIFIDAVNGVHAQGFGCTSSCGTGTIDNPFRSMIDVYRGTDYDSMRDSTYSGQTIYWREGTYGLEGYIDGTGLGGALQWRGPYKPLHWLAYPGENVIIDHDLLPGTDRAYIDFRDGNADDSFIHGIRFLDMGNHAFRINRNRVVFFENHFQDMGPGQDGWNTAFIMFTGRELGTSHHMFVRDNTFSGFTSGTGSYIKTYGLTYSVIEGNLFTNPPPLPQGEVEGLALKHADQWVDVRGNTFEGIYSSGAINGNWNQDGNIEIRFNNIKNSPTTTSQSGSGLLMNHDSFLIGPYYIYRNTIEGTVYLRFADGDAPINFYNNIIVNENSGTPAGSHINFEQVANPADFVSSNNLAGYAADNIIDDNGNLNPSYSSYLGTHGAQVTTTPTGPDTTAPTRSNGAPSGNLAPGTAQATISLMTNEAATCRYSASPGVAYSSMTSTFTTTGAAAHSTQVSGLANGQTYNYYIRCADAGNNANSNDFAITFSVAVPDSTAPSQVTGLSATAASQSHINLAWSPATDNVAVTGYRIYRNGIQIATSATASYQSTGLTPSTQYTYHVSAYDAAGNSGPNSSSAAATTLAQQQVPAQNSTVYLSDLNWTSSFSQFGPIARDMTFGGATPISLDGIIYAKGLGTHAPTNITYNVPSNCTHFVSDVGIDDVRISDGNAEFHLYLDNQLVYSSGPMTGATPTRRINVSLGSALQIRLILDPLGVTSRDNGDWADARFICGQVQGTIQGDVNSDRSVNIQDIQAIVAHFGKTSNYPSNVDLASPGVIDLFDVMVVVRNWGRTQ